MLTRAPQLHSDHTKVQFASFPGIGMKRLLPKLTQRLQPYKDTAKQIEVPKFTLPVPKEDNDTISHLWLWPRVGQFFREGDVIVAETGMSYFYPTKVAR